MNRMLRFNGSFEVTAMRVVGVTLSVLLSPLLILVATLLSPLYFCRMWLQLVRAGEHNVVTTWNLFWEIVKHFRFMAGHVPLFLSIFWYYIASAKAEGCKKGIPFSYSYGGGRLAKLDVYTHTDGVPRPVIVFVYGGAWGGGRRWYYAKLAALIRQVCDAVVVVPEYPTFPTTTIYEQTECVFQAVCWAHENSERYGGNGQLWLVGHSAGAHLCASVIVRGAMARASGSNSIPQAVTMTTKNPEQVNLFGFGTKMARADAVPPTQPTVDYRKVPPITGAVLFSGCYDLPRHLDFEKRRGVHRVSPMTPATDGYWEALSPTILLRSLPPPHDTSEELTSQGEAESSAAIMTPRREISNSFCGVPQAPQIIVQPSLFPSSGIHLVHAGRDVTVAVNQSVGFRDALLSRGIENVSQVQLLDCNHSDVVLGPLLQHRPNAVHPALAAIVRAMHSKD